MDYRYEQSSSWEIKASTETILCAISRCIAEEVAFQKRNHNALMKNVKVSTYYSVIKGHATIVWFSY
jgi:hypothetical protein